MDFEEFHENTFFFELCLSITRQEIIVMFIENGKEFQGKLFYTFTLKSL